LLPELVDEEDKVFLALLRAPFEDADQSPAATDAMFGVVLLDFHDHSYEVKLLQHQPEVSQVAPHILAGETSAEPVVVADDCVKSWTID
jgi:hypothetical protein